jgi:predicted nuclease of predicted toxin-antitoxin system
VNFLIDNPLSPRVAAGLRVAGHDAVHVLDYGMHAATDDAVFGTLLALREATTPSVILFRAASLRRADQQVALILRALPSIDAALQRGAIVVLEHHRLRLRELPISRPRESDG